MKSFKNIKPPSIKRFPKKIEKNPVNTWIRKPTPLEHHDAYEDISRIFPSYVADNYKFFELLTPPKIKIKDWEGYIVRL